MDVELLKPLKTLLPETDFPSLGEGLTVLCGKTLSRNNLWWKACLFVIDRNGKEQLRLYGWQKTRHGALIEGEYKLKQRFNVSKKFANILFEINAAFLGRNVTAGITNNESIELEEYFRDMLEKIESNSGMTFSPGTVAKLAVVFSDPQKGTFIFDLLST